MTATDTTPPIEASGFRTELDEGRLEEFVGRAVVDLAAAESSVACYLGDRLGLYRALAAAAGPMTAAEVAAATGTNERLVLEWARNQVAGGYLEHAGGDTFWLPPEQAAALADDESPAFVAGVFEIVASMWADVGAMELAFRGDGALGWGDHDPRLYSGVERFFTPAYRANLFSTWLPALDGVIARLESGIRVADVGCGFGVSTALMASEYPASTFVGFDVHDGSIEMAQRKAADAGVTDRVSYEVRDAVDLPEGAFDLVCIFDALHDMGDPVGAAAGVRRALADGGVLMVVEPRAGDHLDDNVNPVSRLFYAGSTVLCTPSALAQPGGHALGAQAGPAAITDVLRRGGFEQVRVAVETPFNLVFEAR